ncbi:MAG: polysaccharide biosynthesis tyrosine autokinase [Phycisphaerales bacterium]
MSSIPAARPGTLPARPAAAPRHAPLGFAPIDPIKILHKYKWWLLASIGVGSVLGVAANEAIARIYPSWRSEVVYQCLPVQQDPTKQMNTGVDKDEMERFLLTQATVLNSDRVLRQSLLDSAPTFERDTKWGRTWTTDSTGRVAVAKGLKQLKKVAGASVVTGTSMVRLTVTVQDPDDAAAIARAIHDAFWKDWRNLSAAMSGEQRGPLLQRENDLRAELLRMDGNRDRMMIDYKIDDLRSVRGPAADRMIDEATRKMADAMGTREQALSLQKQYEEIRASGPNSFPDELRDTIERDPVVIDQSNRVSQQRAMVEALRTKFGDEHPRMIQEKANLEKLENELSSTRDEKLRKLFDGELDRAKRMVEASNNQVAQFTKNYNEGVTRKQEIARVIAKFDQLDKDREQVQFQLKEVQSALSALNLTVNVTAQDRVDRIRILNPATKPDTIFFPKLEIMIPLGIVLTFGLTAGVLFLRELLDQRVKSPADIHSIPRTRLLGGVPTVEADPTRPTPETALRDAPTGAIADAYRHSRAMIAKRMSAGGYKSLLVCSGMPQSGATTAASNIALGAAAAEQRVLLVDANFRRPALHRVFKLGEGPGLAEVLAKKATLDTAIQATNTPHLDLLSAGTAPNRATPERLSTELMSQVIQEASGKYDLIVIDAAPAGIAGDALALAGRVDASVLVVKAFGEKRGLIARLRDAFNDSRAEFLGVLVNRVPPTGTGYMAKNIRAAQEYQSTAV